MIGKTHHGAPMQGRETSRRQFLNRVALLAGGISSTSIFALGFSMPKVASGMTATASSDAQSVRHVLVFAGTAGPAAIDQLKTAGFASTIADSLRSAHAIVSKIAGTERSSVSVIGIGTGVSTALQFARSNAATRSVVVFSGSLDDALHEFAALHVNRSYSVLVLETADQAAWSRALSFLGRRMV
jgi:hypothetical protein